MSELFVQQVKTGNFSVACKYASSLSEKEIRDVLFSLIFPEHNFCAYAFAEFLVSTNDNIYFNSLAGDIAGIGINYLNGAYSVQAAHSRREIELSQPHDPLNDGGLFFLFYYPAGPIRSEEVVPLAQKILEQDPNNQQALKVLDYAAEYAAKNTKDPLVLPRNEREELEQYILAGKFTQAKQLFSAVSMRELHEILVYLGCEERNLCAYAFIWFLMKEKEDAELHYLAYRIVMQAYSMKLSGCDAVGIFHLRRAMALEPESEKYMEHFLMLHTPPMGPTPLISDDEAERVATQALKQHRWNSVVTNTLRKMNRLVPKYD